MLFLHRKHDYCRCSAVRPHVFLSHSWHFPTLRLPNLAILATSPHVMHRASQHGHLEISGAVPSACWCLSKACFNSWMRWAERFNKVWPWTMELSAWSHKRLISSIPLWACWKCAWSCRARCTNSLLCAMAFERVTSTSLTVKSCRPSPSRPAELSMAPCILWSNTLQQQDTSNGILTKQCLEMTKE